MTSRQVPDGLRRDWMRGDWVRGDWMREEGKGVERRGIQLVEEERGGGAGGSNRFLVRTIDPASAQLAGRVTGVLCEPGDRGDARDIKDEIRGAKPAGGGGRGGGGERGGGSRRSGAGGGTDGVWRRDGLNGLHRVYGVDGEGFRVESHNTLRDPGRVRAAGSQTRGIPDARAAGSRTRCGIPDKAL